MFVVVENGNNHCNEKFTATKYNEIVYQQKIWNVVWNIHSCCVFSKF